MQGVADGCKPSASVLLSMKAYKQTTRSLSLTTATSPPHRPGLSPRHGRRRRGGRPDRDVSPASRAGGAAASSHGTLKHPRSSSSRTWAYIRNSRPRRRQFIVRSHRQHRRRLTLRRSHRPRRRRLPLRRSHRPRRRRLTQHRPRRRCLQHRVHHSPEQRAQR